MTTYTLAYMAEKLAKYQTCRVHDVDEKNWLRDRVNALEAACRQEHGGKHYEPECPICVALDGSRE